MGIDIDQNGNLIIADSGNHRILKYNIDASKATIIAGGKGKGKEKGQLNQPEGVKLHEG